MRPVFKNLKEFDKACEIKYNMPGEILMENAARGMADFLYRFLKKQYVGKKVLLQIVCGPGNNGGDGLAVARMLFACRYANIKVVQVFQPKSPLCILQTERLKKLGIRIDTEISDCDFLVDAFLGTGIKGSLREEAVKTIEKLNEISAFKIACDIPSGFNSEGIPSPICVKANLTLSAGALKTALYSDAAKDNTGKIKTISLGLPAESYASKKQTEVFLLEKKDMHLPLRKIQNTHKGNFGHAGIYCGDKSGAAILAASACLKFGAGLVTVCGNKPTFFPPDLMHSENLQPEFDTYCLGPGLGENSESVIKNFLEKILLPNVKNNNKANYKKVLFDADALKTLSLAKNLSKIKNCVITPHPKEFQTLIKNLVKFQELKSTKTENLKNLTVQQIQNNRFELARIFSENFPAVVLVLKGANQLIAFDKKTYICTSGSSVLSKAGSGDVLSGMITALLAQNYSCLEAATTACLFLGYTAKKFAKQHYSFSSTASALIHELGRF